MQQSATQPEASSTINSETQIQQYLTFKLGSQDYGLKIASIKELIEYDEVTQIPMTPHFIAGVINLRGSVVPVIDLKQRFSSETTQIEKRTSIVILEIKNDDLKIDVGIMVDLVDEVLDINDNDIEPSPKMGGNIPTDFISGMAKVDGTLLILLDIENILSTDELSAVGSIQNMAETK